MNTSRWEVADNTLQSYLIGPSSNNFNLLLYPRKNPTYNNGFYSKRTSNFLYQK